MAGLFGKAVDFYKSGVKATMSAGLDIARDHLLPKQEINEENLMSKEEATDFSGHTAVINSLAVSNDGETLFSAGKDEKIRMWHTRSGKSAGIVGDQDSEVNQIVVDDDSDLLYSCDVAGSIKKWNWRTAKDLFAQDADASQLAPVAVRPKAHSSDINGIALSPADPSKLFSCGADDKIRLWDTNLSASKEAVAVYNGTGTLADRFYCVVVSHDGAVVVGGTLSNAILVFQVAPPRQIACLKGHTSAVMKVRFGPRDTTAASSLFSCSKDFLIRRWNIGTQKCEMEYKGNLLYSKSGGSSAMTASFDGKRGHNNEVWDFAFTPDGNFFCAVGHKGILGADRDQTKLWDVKTGMCLYNYKGHTEDVFAVVASGKRFYTAGNDNMIKAWMAKHDDSKEHQENRKKKEYRVQMFLQTLPPPVKAKKIAEEYLKLKPFYNELFQQKDFPDIDLTSDTPPGYCVEFNCQMPVEGSKFRAAFVRMYPMANPAVIASINDEIEKYTSLTNDGIIACLSGVGDRPLVISSEQRVAIIRLDCPKFDRNPVFPAFSIRKHIDDAKLALKPEAKLPANKLLVVFKQMIEVVMLLHNKGYIHTDITSKSFRFFPSSPDKSSFYADNASGQLKLSGLQHAVTFAKTEGRSICNPAYAVPTFKAASSGADVTQDQAVWSLVMVLAEMESGLSANDIKVLIEKKDLARFSLYCRREFFKAFDAAFDPNPATRCVDLKQFIRILDDSANPVFQWEAFDAAGKPPKFEPMDVHVSFVLEHSLSGQTLQFAFETYAPGSNARCKATVDLRDIMSQSAGLGTCRFEGGSEQCIRRRLVKGAKLVVWQEEHDDGQWIQCNPSRSAWLATQTPEAIMGLGKFRSFEIKSDQVDQASVDPLKSTHPDWIRLQRRLKSCGMEEFDIIDLKKVTNPTTQSKFVQRRRLLAEKCNGNPNEREVFHLTNPWLLDTITKGDQGFENRLSKWAECGRGAYFAGSPMYSYIYKFYLWWGHEEPNVGEYHPVIKDKWNGEMTILVADVALGECKDLGYGSQSCPNDDFNAWCEEGANSGECGKWLPEEKRMTPKRPPLLQPPKDPAGKKHFEDLHNAFSGDNLNLYDTITSTEGDLNTHPRSQAKVPHSSNENTSWATWKETSTGQVEPLPAANQLVRSYLHPRIKEAKNGKKYGEQFVLFDTVNSCPRFIMTIKKTRPSPFEGQRAPPLKALASQSAAAVGGSKVEVKASKTGKIIKLSASCVVGQQVERDKTVLYEMECSAADAAADEQQPSTPGADTTEADEVLRVAREEAAEIKKRADVVLQQAQAQALQIIAAARSEAAGSASSSATGSSRASVGEAEGFRMSTVQVSGESFSGTLGKSTKDGLMAKLTYNLRYFTLKKSEGILRYHENHGAFTSGAEPKGALNLKTEFQSYSIVAEPQRYDKMHGLELKFTTRASFFLWSTEGPDRFQGLISLLPQSK